MMKNEVKLRPDGIRRRPGHTPQPEDQPEDQSEDEDENLIKPKKLINPISESRSHQELHRELLSTHKSVEKPELQRVLESRKRDQLIRQRKQEEEAHRTISPLEAELLRRHKKLEEYEQQQQENLKAPEFVKVRENLRRTSVEKNQS
ncbi:protein FAM107B-like [Gouania willdenowi]|uniref:protein FAM107B-like n=1 Tax=Gouania willdenowi TaxID=441366 RepID=UPI0010553320|nr:protein FAM107B-like [Gouania willdenowi]